MMQWIPGRMDESQKSEEAVLVLLAQQGDREAFRALVELYDRRLLYFIRRILDETEEAFDVLQETWLHVHRNLPKLRSPRAFRIWIYRIAHDQTVSVLRRTRRAMPLEDLPTGELPDENLPDSVFDAADVVHSALGALTVDHRRVLTLRFLEDLSIEDIASVLQCSTGTVKSRLHYAKAALGRQIKDSEHG